MLGAVVAGGESTAGDILQRGLNGFGEAFMVELTPTFELPNKPAS
jgi:hypothetical protein